jgi:hypothetical protein
VEPERLQSPSAIAPRQADGQHGSGPIDQPRSLGAPFGDALVQSSPGASAAAIALDTRAPAGNNDRAGDAEKLDEAITQDRYGSADVLEFRDIEDPVVGDDDVLVRVRAAGRGPDVWHFMTELPYLVRLMPGFHKVKARVPGRDVAGTVDAVGTCVTDFHPGDEVMGIAEGSFAELAVAKPDKLVVKPGGLTFEQAAAVPISGLTALQAIRDVATVRRGQTVLVIGAAGASANEVHRHLIQALRHLPEERVLGGRGRHGARMWYWMPGSIHSSGHRRTLGDRLRGNRTSVRTPRSRDAGS